MRSGCSVIGSCSPWLEDTNLRAFKHEQVYLHVSGPRIVEIPNKPIKVIPVADPFANQYYRPTSVIEQRFVRRIAVYL